MKKQLLKESLIATLVTLLLTFGITKIPFGGQYLTIISQGVSDMDVYDLYYTGKDQGNNKRDDNIVLVEIAPGRAEIAEQINIINDQQPAVVGIDAVFVAPKDSNDDRKLLQAIHGVKNIVLSNRLKEAEDGKSIMEYNFFEPADSRQYYSGFINFIGGRYSKIRNYAPSVQLNNRHYLSFTSGIIKLYSPTSFKKLEKRHNNIEIINYNGNIKNYTSLTVEELLYFESTGQLSGIMKNKIVLLGFFVKQPPLVLEDLYFSPLNEQLNGNTYPDMYGILIHANILSMILSGDYATLVPPGIAYLFAGITTFIFMFFILKQKLQPKKYDDVKVLIIQLIVIMIVCYLFMQIYNWFLVKISLLPFLVSIVICVEFFGVYKRLALLLNKKWKYKTILKDD